MNRKQKKAKRLRATAHTKHRHEINQERVIDQTIEVTKQYVFGDEIDLTPDVAKESKQFKLVWLFWILLALIVWWIYNINT